MRNAECEKMDVLLSISISSIKTARDKQKKMRYSAFGKGGSYGKESRWGNTRSEPV
jgi:hypothetical protein